jgi:RimJ/RimL family protein N-acetyltransferase/ketosteroid isomerase-like protein
MGAQQDAAQRLAQQVRQALETADLAAFGALLAPDVHWGPPGDPAPPCQNRDQVLSWYRRGRQAGVRAQVSETAVAGDRILVGLRVTGSRAGRPGGQQDRWQVLTVRDGQVVDIRGFGDRGEAAVAAGLAAAPRPGRPPARWAVPGRRLADELVRLRLPDPSDAAALHGYATADGGLDGGWVPLPPGSSLDSCAALVGDWLAGWRNERSFHGPELIIEAKGRLVGLLGLVSLDARTVELGYGVAPDQRGRGYATHAARLAARWLLDDGLADRVELRIGQDNTASQRVAAAAGFCPAGTVTSQARGTGESFEDLRFVLPPP